MTEPDHFRFSLCDNNHDINSKNSQLGLCCRKYLVKQRLNANDMQTINFCLLLISGAVYEAL